MFLKLVASDVDVVFNDVGRSAAASSTMCYVVTNRLPETPAYNTKLVYEMQTTTVVVFCWLAAATAQEFPPGFRFGAASSSYQIEGAWNVSDKAPSSWDHWTHSAATEDSGDIACDSYHLWREDVRIAEELGLDFYRFSISWPRLLPTGVPHQVSEDGRRYYSELIDELLARGIQPYVTIYHWDMPLRLFNLGGWSNPLIVDWFTDYARVVFSLFGSRVRRWVTINEPLIVCDAAYTGRFGPSVNDQSHGVHLCTRHVLLAHARAWRVYDEEFKGLYHGKVSIANQLVWYEPDQPGDEEIAELAREYSYGRFSHPIYSKEGGWPPHIEQRIAENSKKEGYAVSRLPPFSKEEIELIRGTYDYYALNHYTSRTQRRAREGDRAGHPIVDLAELGTISGVREAWPVAPNGWLRVYPEGLRHLLGWLKRRYGDLEVEITENGYATTSRSLDDDDRTQYLKDYMKQMLLAMSEDKVNVTAYTVWSLMDNFEWADGYRIKFGLYDVEFSGARERRARRSARYYRRVLRTRTLDAPPHTEL